jgi:flagellin-like hook-associated protein FlgL
VKRLLNDSELKTIEKYTDVFDKSQDAFEAGQSKVGNNIKFLDSTSDYLSDLKLNLADKDNDVEYVNPYDAIEEYYSQMYCYNASLKVGSQILQQSLMDYLK